MALARAANGPELSRRNRTRYCSTHAAGAAVPVGWSDELGGGSKPRAWYDDVARRRLPRERMRYSLTLLVLLAIESAVTGLPVSNDRSQITVSTCP